jgi:ABC-2 type transport system permease protein
MSGKQLFKKRLVKEWKSQWKVIRSVLDWTIAVYLAIPAIIAVVVIYTSAWKNDHQYWSEGIPFFVLLLIILLLLLLGNFRTYLEEADLIFLLQRKQLLYQLKLYGFLYSAFQAIVGVVFLFIAILPILFTIYKFSIVETMMLFIAVSAFHFLCLTLKKIIRRRLYKWLVFPLCFILTFLLILFANPVVYGIVSIIGISYLIYYHITQLTKQNHWFLKEIEIEGEERRRYTELILNLSMEVEKDTTKQRRKPLLFRQSGRIFRKRNNENGLLELYLKAFLRKKSYVFTYYQLLAVTCTAIILLPLWIKWIVFICFIFFISSWLHSLYAKMIKSPFFSIVPVKKELSDSVWFRFKKVLTIPAIIFIGSVTVLTSIFSMIY